MAERFGIATEFATEILNRFSRTLPEVERLVRHSFLPTALQQPYLDRMADRLLALLG